MKKLTLLFVMVLLTSCGSEIEENKDKSVASVPAKNIVNDKVIEKKEIIEGIKEEKVSQKKIIIKEGDYNVVYRNINKEIEDLNKQIKMLESGSLEDKLIEGYKKDVLEKVSYEELGGETMTKLEARIKLAELEILTEEFKSKDIQYQDKVRRDIIIGKKELKFLNEGDVYDPVVFPEGRGTLTNRELKGLNEELKHLKQEKILLESIDNIKVTYLEKINKEKKFNIDEVKYIYNNFIDNKNNFDELIELNNDEIKNIINSYENDDTLKITINGNNNSVRDSNLYTKLMIKGKESYINKLAYEGIKRAFLENNRNVYLFTIDDNNILNYKISYNSDINYYNQVLISILNDLETTLLKFLLTGNTNGTKYNNNYNNDIENQGILKNYFKAVSSNKIITDYNGELINIYLREYFDNIK